jgi:hypothetical protein
MLSRQLRVAAKWERRRRRKLPLLVLTAIGYLSLH